MYYLLKQKKKCILPTFQNLIQSVKNKEILQKCKREKGALSY